MRVPCAAAHRLLLHMPQWTIPGQAAKQHVEDRREEDPEGRHAEHSREDRHAHRMAHLGARSEEHTSELQSLMRNSYAVFCMKKKQEQKQQTQHNDHKKTQ